MAQDELEEINGIRPNIWLADGEEQEVGSATRYDTPYLFRAGDAEDYPSKSKYKIKRTFDHYYWYVPSLTITLTKA